MKIMISGGGTGGHIFPALAIADAVKKLRPETGILFVGARGRMEMEKVPAAGYPIEGLWISGLHRKKIWRNISFPFKLISSLWKSWQLIGKFQPDVVIGVGGFASGPLLEVATRKGIPTLIQEQNSFAGLTNKMLGKRVDRIGVAFEEMDQYFPKGKLFLSGNPVRQSLLHSNWTRDMARHQLGIADDKNVVLVVGGSLGARTINQMLGQNTREINNCPELHFIWQYGALYEEEYRTCETAGLSNVSAVKFIDDMALVYAAADLVVSRAGALTIAELGALGKAALLIPSPNVAEDHQTRNARMLVDEQAADILTDKLAVSKGIGKINTLVQDKRRLIQLGKNIKSFYQPNAAERIAQEIIKLADAS